VTAVSPAGRPGFVNVLMEFDEGGVGQLSLWGGPAPIGRTWLDVDSDGGTLRAAMPRQVGWRDSGGRHELELPAGLAEVWVVDRFLQAARSNELPVCSFARAHQTLKWLRAARQSRNEGGTVRLD
jgi:predicted dehydrogenase